MAGASPQGEGTGGSSLAPFRHPVFAVLWTATVVSNIGTWMQNAAAGWLMTGLDPHPGIVALVQVATAAPMFLFGLPAGALADIVDRRKLLLGVTVASTLLIVVFALLVRLDWVTPAVLLAFTFLGGVAAALTAPAWQSVVPLLVPRVDLQPAVALNSVGINISRAIGPAAAGFIIAQLGLAAPFWLNAVSNLGVIAALLWWRPPAPAERRLPAERFVHAIATGLRHARHNAHLQATLIRSGGFFIFASAYWALLPLVARQQVAGGPRLYGLLLGAIGAGAVAGAFALPRAKAALGPDRLAVAGTIGTALAMAVYGLARDPATALAASVLAGVSWIAVLATINVSGQMALPAWVRGRGLALFVTVQFGGLAIGSFIWGHAGGLIGLTAAHLAAAGGLLATVPLLGRWKLQTGAGVDMTPSMHWPQPVVGDDIDRDGGPVMVTIEYRVAADGRAGFLAAVAALAGERRRDGAYDWRVFEDAADPGRFLETFLVDSWLEHLRQHERVTNADRVLQ
ncbi:MAG: MFS transporter, partial [Alphaproteobacteria bacterium]